MKGPIIAGARSFHQPIKTKRSGEDSLIPLPLPPLISPFSERLLEDLDTLDKYLEFVRAKHKIVGALGDSL